MPIVTKLDMSVQHNKPQLINTAKKVFVFGVILVRIRIPYLSVFSPNAEKYEPK